MDFYPKTFGDYKVQYFDSEEDSEIQIVFIPGLFNSEVWKHQVKYFSKNYRTIIFERESKSYEEQKEIVKSILRNKNIDNAVLISAGPGNALSQEFEDREDVVATVLTSVAENYPEITKNKYSLLKHTAFRKPKLAHKLFFSDKTKYKIVKDLVNDFELPEYEHLQSFLTNHNIEGSLKNSLVIHPEEDNLSSKEKACSLKPEAQVSIIQSAGPFSFYEKPEEYNKAVHDFLKRLDDFVESKKVRKTREKNYSLSQFEEEEREREESSDEDEGSREKPVLWE